jgi:predicted dehydrogenase
VKETDAVSRGAVGHGRFRRFCVVGLGNHARTKLIPALVANGQMVVGTVSRRLERAGAAPAFGSVAEALAALPADTVFVIASPPPLHFAQAMEVVGAGRDLFVEKPAFATGCEARTALAEAAARSAVLVEAFMHRHTELYRRLVAGWHADRARIEAIEVAFLIPVMPAGTFRQQDAINCSSLYDVGCYPLSLLADLGLPLGSIGIAGVDSAGDPAREAIQLAGRCDGVQIDVRIGVGEYTNRVSFHGNGGGTRSFSPFFSGRPGNKTISDRSPESAADEVLHDTDAFEAMFLVSREAWIATQQQRGETIVEVAETLERLGRTLEAHRRE